MADTGISMDDLTRLGFYFVLAVGVQHALGHVSPAQSMMYVDPTDESDEMRRAVCAAFQTCLVGSPDAEPAREWLADFTTRHDLLTLVGERATEGFFDESPRSA